MDGKSFTLRLRSEDGQVWAHVLTIVLVALVVAVIIIQFGPIMWNHISINGIADDAAHEAAITYSNSHGNMDRVSEAVQRVLDDNDAVLDNPITVIEGKNGGPDSIAISVRKIVNTYLFENVGYLCRYTEAHGFSEDIIP
ncbi:MAG: hypothetical protein JW854_16330 [Actinobacteria bacterium]|nr:hypothetical protein [Actinomycetota bacterium]